MMHQPTDGDPGDPIYKQEFSFITSSVMADLAHKKSAEKLAQYQIPKTRKNVKISSFEEKNDILRSHKKILNLAQPPKSKLGEEPLE